MIGPVPVTPQWGILMSNDAPGHDDAVAVVQRHAAETQAITDAILAQISGEDETIHREAEKVIDQLVSKQIG